jgi:hypothetical protein
LPTGCVFPTGRNSAGHRGSARPQPFQAKDQYLAPSITLDRFARVDALTLACAGHSLFVVSRARATHRTNTNPRTPLPAIPRKNKTGTGSATVCILAWTRKGITTETIATLGARQAGCWMRQGLRAEVEPAATTINSEESDCSSTPARG